MQIAILASDFIQGNFHYTLQGESDWGNLETSNLSFGQNAIFNKLY